MISKLPRPEVAELDLSAERIWPPERLEIDSGWRCRLDRGASRRANSVLAVDWSGNELGPARDRVAALYREAGLRPCFQITPASTPPELDERLAYLGYASEGDSLVMLADPADVLAVAETGRSVKLAEKRPSRTWLSAFGVGRPPGEVDAKAAILGRIQCPVTYAELREDDETFAVGVGILDGTLGWFNCMQTRPDQRRRGLARSILTALATSLASEGASRLALQVEMDNPAGQALYQGFGFEAVYSYHYRTLPLNEQILP